MIERLFSTSELAALFRVNESTVKRWTNDGLLACYKTPGGHRKYRTKDVHSFLREYEYHAAGLDVLTFNSEDELALRVAAMERDWATLAHIFRTYALRGDAQKIFELLSYLAHSGISFPDMCDSVIAPAFHSIGEMWEKGSLGIDDEHIASYAAVDALTRVYALMPRKPESGKKILCSVVQSEAHEIGLLCVRYALELEGFRVQYLGANLPIESLISAIEKSRPAFVCISATCIQDESRFVQALKKIRSTSSRRRPKVIIGGCAVSESIRNKIPFDHHYALVGELVAAISG